MFATKPDENATGSKTVWRSNNIAPYRNMLHAKHNKLTSPMPWSSIAFGTGRPPLYCPDNASWLWHRFGDIATNQNRARVHVSKPGISCSDSTEWVSFTRCMGYKYACIYAYAYRAALNKKRRGEMRREVLPLRPIDITGPMTQTSPSSKIIEFSACIENAREWYCYLDLIPFTPEEQSNYNEMC